jgi:hypothetical protein
MLEVPETSVVATIRWSGDSETAQAVAGPSKEHQGGDDPSLSSALRAYGRAPPHVRTPP